MRCLGEKRRRRRRVRDEVSGREKEEKEKGSR